MKQSAFLAQIRRLLFHEHAVQSTDGELLNRFRDRQDQDAFATLVHRHAPLVWRVCRRMLRDEHLAEDVFQATFLVLARRAGTIRHADALVGWLHGVATRLSLKARVREAKHSAQTLAEEPVASDGLEEMTVRELRMVLDEELLQLPAKFRFPLVLCYLEGKTRDEAAQQLDCPLETLKSRLERGRELLHARLVRRRLALSTAFLSLLVAEGAAQAGPSAAFVQTTAAAAGQFATEALAAGAVSSRAVGLARGFISGTKLAKVKAVVVGLLLLGVVAAGGIFLGHALGDKAPSTGQAVAGADVFEGPPAPLVPRLRADLPAAAGPLRRLVVEERVGAARQQELVRVPLFFHEGECADPHALQVFAEADTNRQTPIPYQPDDIRRAEDGSVSRIHLYFAVDLTPWERQKFVVVRGENAGQKLPPVPVQRDAGQVTLAGDDLQVTFWTEGPHAGSIAAIRSALGAVSVPDNLLAPSLTLDRQGPDLAVTRHTPLSYRSPDGLAIRDLRFGAGPLFAKFMVRIGPRGLPDTAEFTYIVPRHGNLFVQTQRLFADELVTTDVVGASANALLTGRLLLGDAPVEQRVVRVPAGLRRLTRATTEHLHPALVNPRARLSLLAIPYVQRGVQGIELTPDGSVSILGNGEWQRTPGAGSEDLRSFWGQVRFVFSQATTEDELWEVSRVHMQPLTAVVDEPGVATDDLHLRLKELMKQFPATHSRSWMQEAGRLYTLGDQAGLAKLLASEGGRAGPDTLAYWLDGARKARAEVTKDGTLPLREDDKGRASGPLDPWNVTHAATPMIALAALGQPSAPLDRLARAMGQAQRLFNGRVDPQGFPYIDCFHRALNMQTGPIAAGLHGARKAGDADLLQFYRDCARSAGELAIHGRGERSSPAAGDPGASDFLYGTTSDYFLRVAELVAGEDLWIHPAVYGRYFDCVDVTADLCHRTVAPSARTPSWYRANFFRGQGNDRRLETWSAGPFLGLLARAGEGGSVGLTEACYFARHVSGQRLNWIDITTFFHADIALREGLPRYRSQSAPPLPAGIQVTRREAETTVRWQPVADPALLGYRIYRAEHVGGPWTLLNSPYTEPPGRLVTETEYRDTAGRQVYYVTAVDTSRRESRWFPDEPLPTAGTAARP
ncbi:hypothetical protein AYO44_15650 [Planctomycetaceae bacterium SCGC AG-212-F19]|nr:hypothetical protein AYO44_15650 [Planctomycetaceae bacterium SCGC AG-212-F19]